MSKPGSRDRIAIPPFSLAQRDECFDQLRRESWDVLIVGGGINGAGVARDLALSNTIEKLGLKIALIEKNHFGSGTSSKNSQLVHGGLRYLKYLNLSLVREALKERNILMRLAPHLVRPQPFLLPFGNVASSLYYSTGLFLYDALAGKSAIKNFRRISGNELARIAPALNHDRARSAAIFYDGVMEAARLVLANVRDAATHGATMLNYVEANSFLLDGRNRVVGISARDKLAGRELEIKTKVIVNAAGPWGDLLRGKTSAHDRTLHLVRGSHLVFPRLFDDKLALSFFDNDGRIIFAIPWGATGELTLVGTTEALHTETPDEVRITEDERDYLIHAVSRWLPKILHEKPVGTYSSLRPLIDGNSSSLSSASRDARIWVGPDGMINIAGGKYTTYRAMAAAAAKLVFRELNVRLQRQETTATHPLGALSPAMEDEVEKKRISREFGLDEAQIDYFARLYGDRLEEMLSLARSSDGLEKIHPELPLLFGQMAYAVKHEAAVRLSDFTTISTYLRYYRRWTRREIHQMAAFMGGLLGWDARQIEQETDAEFQFMGIQSDR
jgi:glycerol-3-phosphate dehydrogenase